MLSAKAQERGWACGGRKRKYLGGTRSWKPHFLQESNSPVWASGSFPPTHPPPQHLPHRDTSPMAAEKTEMCPKSPSSKGLKRAPTSFPLNPASPLRLKPSIWGPQTKRRIEDILLPCSCLLNCWLGGGVRGVHYNLLLWMFNISINMISPKPEWAAGRQVCWQDTE